jgi:hypothetical protein
VHLLQRDGGLGQRLLDGRGEGDDPRSPWFTITRSGSSVNGATSASRRAGSGSMAADVLRETGTAGQAARTACSAARHGAGASGSRPPSS